MKRFLGTLSLGMLLCVPTVLAQTNTFPASGNVGIGTTTPQTTLQVVGGAYAADLGGANLVPYASDMSFYDTTTAEVSFVDGRTITALYSHQDGSNGCYQWGTTGKIPIDENQDYEFSMWVNANGIQNIYMGFFVYDANGNEITSGGLGNPYFHAYLENTNGGWERITAFLRAARTPANSDYSAVNTSNKTGPNAIDWVMPSNAAYTMMRWGSCYGGTGTTGVAYIYNPSIVAVAHDLTYGAIWPKFNGTTYNVGVGTSNPGAKLEVDGNLKLTAGSGASITFADGTTQSTAYTGVTCGGDYAESVDITGARNQYGPGDLLVIDPSDPSRFLKASEPYSTSVAGVFSTKPGTVGRRQTTPKSPDEIPMAVVGIVPAKVSAENGPILPGDLLVSSSTPGFAMKGTDRNRMLGAVVGKAMGTLNDGKGVIEVLVTLQ